MMPFSTVASSAEASAALAMISMASSTTSHSSAYSSTHTSASASPLKKRPLICDSCRVARKRCDTLKPACSRCVARGGACRYSSAPPALLLSAQSPPAANENSKNENNKNENKNENENKNKKNKSEKAAKACLWCHRKKTRCDMRRPQCKTCAAKARVCEYASAGVTREVPLKLDMRVIPVGDDCHEEEMLREEAHKRLLVRARLDSLIGELAAADDSDPTPPALVSPSSESSASSTSSASSAISASLSDYSSQHYPLPLSHSSNLALANVVVARFPPKPPGSPLVKLSCGKLWIEDPVTSEKFYFCPACKKEYGTANGLKACSFAPKVKSKASFILKNDTFSHFTHSHNQQYHNSTT
ncbi:hypothetical protein BDR26DRAFT_860710 [Obelidium mucronatum]|nr:hypothetical protein BDR26DRAFT_860710 [Obelidium mucronatum]